MQRRMNFMPVCVTQGETRALTHSPINRFYLEIIKLQTMQQLGAALCLLCAALFQGLWCACDAQMAAAAGENKVCSKFEMPKQIIGLLRLKLIPQGGW